MTFIDAFAQPRMLLACGLFSVANLLLAKVEVRFSLAMSAHNASAWLSEHLYLPLLRVFSLLLFIGLAYPALFGLREAPGIFALLGSGDQRVSQLINLAFLLSLLLPLLPWIGRLPTLVLPAQSLLAAAMVFHWLAGARGIEVNYWPGWIMATTITIWLILAQYLAAWITHTLIDHSHPDSAERERIYFETAVVFLQVPAILIYTVGLGGQLH